MLIGLCASSAPYTCALRVTPALHAEGASGGNAGWWILIAPYAVVAPLRGALHHAPSLRTEGISDGNGGQLVQAEGRESGDIKMQVSGRGMPTPVVLV